jgi:hypothetical protein
LICEIPCPAVVCVGSVKYCSRQGDIVAALRFWCELRDDSDFFVLIEVVECPDVLVGIVRTLVEQEAERFKGWFLP